MLESALYIIHFNEGVTVSERGPTKGKKVTGNK